MTIPPGLIRIGELSRRVHVSVDRLRAWERRYGVLQPQRTAGGFRLYTPADERRVRAMQAHLAAGLSAAEAAVAVLATGTPPAAARSFDLRNALREFDAPSSHAAIDRLFGELGVEETLRAVVFPLLRDLGQCWARAEITVAHEHFASNLIQARLLALLREPSDAGGPLALLACPPGEHHTLGLIGFGIALRNRGWRIAYLGADTPIEDTHQAATATGAAVTVLSAAMAAPLARVQNGLRDHAAHLPLAIAGAGASPTLAQRVGAQLLDGDPVTAADAFAAPTPTTR
jgi:DNA-binding transcriptional MerR regulator